MLSGNQEEAYVGQQADLDLFCEAQARLQGLHLALVDTPRLLVCTYPNCEHGIIFSEPTFKDILQHLKKHRQAIAPTTELKLKVLLEELDLPLVMDAYINPTVLPLPMIPGVELLENGHWCKVCGYTIHSNSAYHKHFRMNPDHFRGKNNEKILMQVIYNYKGRKRFLYVHNKGLTPTPPPVLPAAATFATDAMDPALCTKVDRFLAKDKASVASLSSTDSAKAFAGHMGPWAERLDWVKYWSGKPVTKIGALGSDVSRWPGLHLDVVEPLVAKAKEVLLDWMTELNNASPLVQCAMRAYSDETGKPYNLAKDSLRKRANIWAHMLGLLAHLYFDGEQLYFSKSTSSIEEHLALESKVAELLRVIQDIFGTPEDSAAGCLLFKGISKEEFTSRTILKLSYRLLEQKPGLASVGAGKLTLARLFLHLCVNRDGTLHGVTSSTSTIASLEFGLRAVLFKWLLDPKYGKLHNLPPSDQQCALQAKLKELTHHNSFSVSSYLQLLHCFGTTLSRDEGTPFCFSWNREVTILQHGTLKLPVERLQALFHGALKQAEQILRMLCLLPTDFDFGYDLSKLLDDQNNTVPGFNFAKASFGDKGAQPILSRAVGGQLPLQHPLMDPLSTKLEFDLQAAEHYFQQHDKFTLLLGVLIQLGSGQPARGTELLFLQHTNTLAGPRNLFLYDGSLFSALCAIKGAGRQKIIPRFLPHAVACLVMYYVSQVVPFVRLLHNQVKGPRHETPYLLVNHRGESYTTSNLSNGLESQAKMYINAHASGLNMRMWRQVATSIDRKLIRPKHMALGEEEEEADNAHDLQAGHSTVTAQQHYGVDLAMLHQLTQESIDAMLAVSERWHMFWKTASRYGEAVKPFVVLKDHTSNDSKMITAIKRQLDCMQEGMWSLQDEVRSLKRIQVDTEAVKASNQSGVITASSSAARSAVLLPEVSKALFHATGKRCAKSLEQAYALNAIHSKESPLVVVLGTGGGKSALFMSPLNWLEDASEIIVVVPFTALAEDLIAQCQQKGISADRWLCYQNPFSVRRSRLIFVAAENCYQSDFVAFAVSLQAQSRLQAVFFDESHVCITQASFRSAMDKVWSFFAALEVPKYFLTATLPPSMVATFKAALSLQNLGMIRAQTNRANISYAVQKLTSTMSAHSAISELLANHPCGAVMVFSPSKAEVKALAEHLGCAYLHSDVLEQARSKMLSTWLLCSATQTDNCKRVLVGTSGIGCGINPHNVVLVVHCGSTWDMVSYVQESGRAGRSGKEAHAVLLANNTGKMDEQVQSYIDKTTCRRLSISTYMDGMPVTCFSCSDFQLCDLCRKDGLTPSTPPLPVALALEPPLIPERPHQQLAAHSTKHSHHASSSDSQISAGSGFGVQSRQGSCLTSSLSSTSSLSLSLSSPSSFSERVAFNPAIGMRNGAYTFFTKMLEQVKERCSLCYLLRHQHTCADGEEHQHHFVQCNCYKELDSSLGGQRINATSVGKIRPRDFAKNVGCYSCFLPMNICRTQGAVCCSRKYSDAVLPVVEAILLDNRCRSKLGSLLAPAINEPLNFSNAEAVKAKLGKEVYFHGERVFLAFAIFLAAIHIYGK